MNKIAIVWEKLKTKLPTFKGERKTQGSSGFSQPTKDYDRKIADNPYLQSKLLWNDMYGSLQIKLQNSYRLSLILAITLVIAIIGIITIAAETKVKPIPFIIHGNEVLTLSQQGNLASAKPKLAIYFAKQFIRDARTVTSDGDANAEHVIGAYSLTSGAATEVLKDFYKRHQPDVIARHLVKSVVITSILQKSAHTLDLRWREVSRDVNSGNVVHTANYIAEMTYVFKAPSQNETIIKHNPLGFYITELSWSNDEAEVNQHV